MKRTSLILVVISLVTLSVSSAGAAGIQQGTVELNTQTYFNRASYSVRGNSISNITNLNLAGNVGYFVTGLVELVGGLAVVYRRVDPDYGSARSTTDYGGAAAVRLNFASSSASVLPFMGIGAGVLAHSGYRNTDRATIAMPSVEVGLRFIVGSSASINMGIAYEHQLNALGNDISGDVLLIGVGISAFVNGGPE